MTSTTSYAAYHQLVTNGILAEAQLAVWLALAEWGPMTGQELADQMGKRGAWKRLSELKALGLVRERPPRLCRITHRAAIVWEFVDGWPKEGFKRENKPAMYLVTDPKWSTERLTHHFCETRERAEEFARRFGGEVIKVREVKRWIPK